MSSAIAVYEFKGHSVELFGEPDKLLWRERTFLEMIGRCKEDVSEASLVNMRYVVNIANGIKEWNEERQTISHFLDWIQHDAAHRLKKIGAYSARDDVYHKDLAGVDTEHGFIHFAGNFRYPAWSWSSLMQAFDFDTNCCPKLFEAGNDIDDSTLRQMHFIIAENPRFADNEDLLEVVAHVQEKCAWFIKHHVMKGILPLLASQGNVEN